MDRVKMRLLIPVLVVLLLLIVIIGSCARRLVTDEPSRIWTPVPVSGAPLVATRSIDTLPTLAPPTPAKPTQVALPPTLPAQTAIVESPALEPTPDPNLVVITEADVLRAIMGGAAGQGGAELEGVGLDFTDDKMLLSATRLTYGVIEVRNLLLAGRLVARDGRLRFEAESIAPGGLVATLIPVAVNQALAQYTSQWYIEEVRTRDGRLELRIR